MNPGDGLRLFMILMGLIVLVLANISSAKRHMTVLFCAVWSIVSVLFILAGILLRPSQWNLYISWSALLLILFGVLLLLAVAFYFSLCASQLSREIRELAIQVSLLNQEVESIQRELTADRPEIGMEMDEEAFVRN